MFYGLYEKVSNDPIAKLGKVGAQNQVNYVDLGVVAEFREKGFQRGGHRMGWLADFSNEDFTFSDFFLIFLCGYF